jgi:NDP-sugar pyrophosphorylase family protein
VAILAGGLATRLHPVTRRIPKALVQVAGRPFAAHQADLLSRQGVREVVWLVGHLGDQIEAELGDGRRWDMRFVYVHDGPVLLGTGGAIRQALPRLGDAFFVMYGDSYLEADLPSIEAAFRESGLSGLMTVYRNEGRFDASNVEYRNGRIVSYDKREPSPAMTYIDWGLGVLTARAFDGYPESSPLDLSCVYQDLLARHDLAGYEVHTRFYEIGSPDGLAEADAYLRSPVLEGRRRRTTGDRPDEAP